MKFTKKKQRRVITRTEADIIASKAYFDDRMKGKEKPFAEYDNLSDKLCDKILFLVGQFVVFYRINIYN